MITKKRDNLFLIFVIGLILLLAIRDIAGFGYNKFILVAYTLVFCAISPTDILAPMICFMFPLTWGLPYTYIFFGAIVIFWLKRKKIPGHAISLITLFLLMEIAASFWYSDTDYILIIKYMSVVSIFFTFLYDDSINKEQCIKAFYIGSVVLCTFIIITTFKTAPSNWLYLFSRGWFRFGSKQAIDNDGMMLAVNANTLAYYSVVGIALSFTYIVDSVGREKVIHICCLGLFLISGVFTVSISWTVAAAFCILLFIFVETRSWRAVLGGLGAFIILAFVVSKVLESTPELLEGFITRLTTTDLSTGDQRTDLMLEYHNVFWSNARFVFLGTGVTQYRQVTNIFNSFHNMAQQIFVSYGILAGIAFFVGMFLPFRRIRRGAASLVYWIPMIAVLLFTQTIQFVNPESLMLPYVIAFYMLKVQTEKVEADEALYNYS